jgi:radical SAM protein with 4Fe4S-binding SPASM domain
LLYRQKDDTFIRIYDNVGYITNLTTSADRVTDASGAVFLKALSRTPRSLLEIINDIKASFSDADPVVIEKDILDFFIILEEDGFITSGENRLELDSKDKPLSHLKQIKKNYKPNFSKIIPRVKRNTQEFLYEHFNGKPPLMELQIELTGRCNERCIHCYIPHEYKKKKASLSDIDPILFYDIIDQCHDMKVLGLTFSDGEPLLHKNFLDFLSRLKNYDISINILSNLTTLNDEMIAEIKSNRHIRIHASLYSMNHSIHDSITQFPGSFFKTKNAILKLIAQNIPIQISCPVMKQNKNDYVDVLKWAQEFEVRATTDYIIMARYDHTVDNLENRLSLNESYMVINDIINNDLEYQQAIYQSDLSEIEKQDTRDGIICGVCLSSICMTANGDVYPCSGWRNYIVGNVLQQSLRTVWENSPRVQYLRGLRKSDFSKCSVCKNYNFCSLCMVRNANENSSGDPLIVSEHFCKVAELNRSIVFDWKRKLQKNWVHH